MQHSRFAAAVVVLVAAAGVLAVPPTALAASWSPSVPVGSNTVVPSDASTVGATSTSANLDFDIVLAPRDAVALQAFATAVSTPGSPEYRHYLAKGQFATTFGATPATISLVQTKLRAAGLSVADDALDGLLLKVSGSVAKISKALATSFRNYRLKSGRVVSANVAAPHVDPLVAPAVKAVVGLDGLATQGLRPALELDRSAGDAATLGDTPPTPSCDVSAATSDGAYTADQIAAHYGFDSAYAAGDFGSGVHVAVAEFDDYDPTDVAAYQNCYGISATVTPHIVTDPSTDSTVGGHEEADLDIEDIVGLAPQATVDVYEVDNSAGAAVDLYGRIAADDYDPVVSTSWTMCEPDAENDSSDPLDAENLLFEQMAAQGQTVFAASGDDGSSGCYSSDGASGLAVDDPASQPYVTGVGGTSWSGGSETGWTGSGGGLSTYWPLPSWQTGVRDTSYNTDPTGCTTDGVSGYCRQVPDVSALADPDAGYAMYLPYDVAGDSEWTAVGGTSVAAPTWAALVALADATCSASVGFANPLLYADQSTQPTALTDITSGSNNEHLRRKSTYTATNGYDLVTGLGVPGSDLVSALCDTALVDGSGTVTASPSTVAVSAPATLTFIYTENLGRVVDGDIQITVPQDWTQPTTTAGAPGYVTASSGTVSINGQTIDDTGVNLDATQSLTVVYGDTSGGGPGALPPTTTQVDAFDVAECSGGGCTLVPLASNPSVTVTATPSSGGGGSGSSGGGGGGGGAAASAGSPTLVRVAGDTRVETAIAASQVSYPKGGSAGAVVLSRSDAYADALAGTPLAADKQAPLLLTGSSALDPATQTEIERVLPAGGTVYLLGGTSALAPSVANTLLGLGFAVQRIAGADRYATAVAIAAVLGNPGTVFEADGTNFPDALSAGAAAIAQHAAILLTSGSVQARETAGYLAAHPGDSRIAIGGPAALADRAATSYVGADRYTTSAMVAAAFFATPTAIGVASGATFPDALGGGVVAGAAGGPLLLVPMSGALPTTTTAYLRSASASVSAAWAFGGTSAIDGDAFGEVAAALVAPTS